MENYKLVYYVVTISSKDDKTCYHLEFFNNYYQQHG